MCEIWDWGCGENFGVLRRSPRFILDEPKKLCHEINFMAKSSSALKGTKFFARFLGDLKLFQNTALLESTTNKARL
ncbi:hypothetical protein THIOM_003015 [Candidatus Thiomargarita nelsonii]|uniref:Uncharacterized protein n=1 Tax=Candidatus Thiomargarita nelsonii TaxID=1003181 RepID=A0A176RZT8_9GAMM|nr:hypothetical protein THIOM_003015 [Candidatus Thiomargarita nelsonii]